MQREQERMMRKVKEKMRRMEQEQGEEEDGDSQVLILCLGPGRRAERVGWQEEEP